MPNAFDVRCECFLVILIVTPDTQGLSYHVQIFTPNTQYFLWHDWRFLVLFIVHWTTDGFCIRWIYSHLIPNCIRCHLMNNATFYYKIFTIDKIHQFSKIAVTFEPIIKVVYPLTWRIQQKKVTMVYFLTGSTFSNRLVLAAP